MTSTTPPHPWEAGLGWIAQIHQGLCGRSLLKAQKEQGTARKLVGFELVERGVPGTTTRCWMKWVIGGQGHQRNHEPHFAEAHRHGLCTDRHGPGSPLWIDIRGKALKGVVKKLPFLSKP